MGTIDKELNNYIWDNLSKLKPIFSDKIYSSLLQKKEDGNREEFADMLELIVDLDSDFFDKIKNEYSNNLSIDEVSQLLDVESYDNFADKKQYIDRAEYWVENYNKIDDKYALLLDSLGLVYVSLSEYNKAELLYEKALKISENKIIHSNFNIFMQKLNRLLFLNSRNSNLMFRIDSLEVKNFKQYNKPFFIEFSKQVNIIVGQNAIGKTTLLQAIALGLLKENILDARELDYNNYITKNEDESEIIIGHNGGREKRVKIKKDKREIDDNYFIPFVLAYGSNFFTRYNVSADKIVADILDKTIHKGVANSIFKDYVDEFWNPLTILNELDRSEHTKAKEKSKIFLETINIFLEEYRLIRENRKHFFRKDDNKTELYLDDLSEGYRSNILLITDMLVKILGVGWTPETIEGIVLIDEFDKHLHPKWQSRLVNQLTKTFPKIQFIMTTHNPMSILDREPDEIIKLVEIKDGINAIRGKGTKSIDVSTVLLEYFTVESTVSETMQEHIKNFNRLKLKKVLTSEEQKELKELEGFLGNTVASNFIYDRKYLKFLEFIRDKKEIDFDKYEKTNEAEMDELLKDFGDFFND